MLSIFPFVLTAAAVALVITPGAVPANPAQLKTHKSVPARAGEVVAYWQSAGLTKWFTWNPVFDTQFHDRFLALHEAAVRGELRDWATTSEGALALVILLDQFPRHAFRGTPRMYASDHLALEVAKLAVSKGLDRSLSQQMRFFLYQPFGHSEDLAMQGKWVALTGNLGSVHQQVAKGHHGIVNRYGRFPHRNAVLQRTSRADELAFLSDGGFDSWKDSNW